MGDMALTAWNSDQFGWLLYATYTAPLGGDLIQVFSSANVAPVVSQWNTHLIIDGLALRILAAGNTTGYIYFGMGEMTVGTGGFNYIGNFSIAAGVPGVFSWTHLNLPYVLPSTRIAQFVGVNCAIAQADSTRISVWGHYQQIPQLAEPQEVTVKGVQFFPRKKVSGPV